MLLSPVVERFGVFRRRDFFYADFKGNTFFSDKKKTFDKIEKKINLSGLNGLAPSAVGVSRSVDE